MIEVKDIFPPGTLLGDWLEWGKEFESPDSFLLFALLTSASCAINGRIVVNPGSEPCVKTNIYTLLYGPSGSRKSTAMRKSLYVLGRAWGDAPILPRSFSMEAIFSHLAKESKEKNQCGGMICSDEFSQLVGGAEYLENNLRFLSDLWDCPNLYPRTTHAHGLEEIRNPYMVVQACSSPAWLEDTPPNLLTGGALRRILIVYEFRPKIENDDPKSDEEMLEGIIERFEERVGRTTLKPSYMKLDEAARKQKAAWYRGPVRKLRKETDDRVGHFASCMEAHALKLAGIIQVLEGGDPTVLGVQALKKGQLLVERLVPHMLQAYAALVPTPYAKLRACILRTAMERVEGLKKSELDSKVVQSMGVKPSEVAMARAHMIHEGLLTERRDGTIMAGA